MNAALFSRCLPLRLLVGVLICLCFSQCRSPRAVGSPYEQRGIASWIHDRYHGRLTAFGTVYDRNAFTASSPTLPYGMAVRVTHLRNGRSVDVVIVDRFNYPGRIIDLSPAAAAQIGLLQEQLSEVSVVPLQTNGPQQGAGYGAPPPMSEPMPSGSTGRRALVSPYNPSNPPLLSRPGYSGVKPTGELDPALASTEDRLDFDFDEVIRSSLFDPPYFAEDAGQDFTHPNYEVQGIYPIQDSGLVVRAE